MNRPLTLAALVVLTACSPDFDPASKIEKLRVVAIQAEPPEIDPEGLRTASLTSLVLRADFVQAPSRTTTVVHLACVPVPGDSAPTPCVMLPNLRDPATAMAAGAAQACASGGGGSARWPAIDLAGIESCAGAIRGPATVGGIPVPPARVTVPAGFAFPPSGPERIGVEAVVLAFALDATPDELVAGVGTACPGATSRRTSPGSGPSATTCSRRSGCGSAGRPRPTLPTGTRAWRASPRGRLLFTRRARRPSHLATCRSRRCFRPERRASRRCTRRSTPPALPSRPGRRSGSTRGSTAGDLEDLHTRSATAPEKWTVGAVGSARVAVVVRDLRGGTAWAVRDVVVAR